MLYALGHILRDRLPVLWDLAERLNGALFSLRYGRRLKRVPETLSRVSDEYRFVELKDCPAKELEAFFAAQPEESYRFFKPHAFDEVALRKLQKNKAFLAYMVTEGSNYVGYFFLRSFFFGRSYLGKMVDTGHQGQGIGTMMCLAAMDIATTLGLRMFETISRDNPASLRSSSSVLETRIVKELPDNYLYIEDLRRK